MPGSFHPARSLLSNAFARIADRTLLRAFTVNAQTFTPGVAALTRATLAGVTTIGPERTFLDKILILHGMTCYFDAKGVLRGNGRMSRHYYDVHRLMDAPTGEKACADDVLIEDCVRHARMSAD